METWKAEARIEFRALIAEAVAMSNGKLNPTEMAEEFVTAVTGQHRTLQQSFMGGIKLAIHQYASASSDLRNQSAVAWAKEVAAIPNSDIRFPVY